MSTNGLQFQNNIVEKLFENDYRISTFTLHDIIELGMTVEDDLLLIMDECLKNPDYFIDELPAKKGGFAPTHAVYLLREIGSKRAFSRVFRLLTQDATIVDRLFGNNFITDEAWSYVCHLAGKEHINDCVEAIMNKDLDVYVRIALSNGLAQMGVHYKECKKAIVSTFGDLLLYIIENIPTLREEEGIFGPNPDFGADIEFISNLALDLLDLNATQYQERLDELFDNNLIEDTILEADDAIFKEHKITHNTIFEIYQNLKETTIDEEPLDEDEDEPKIKKMKN